jgi:hypothetical protein
LYLGILMLHLNVVVEKVLEYETRNVGTLVSGGTSHYVSWKRRGV